MSGTDGEIDQLVAELDFLNGSPIKNVDVARATYLLAMGERLAAAVCPDPKMVSTLLIELDQYKLDAEHQQTAAKDILLKIQEDFPDNAEQAEVLYQHCHFYQLKQLCFRLKQALASEHMLTDLRGIIQDINRDDGGDECMPLSFDELLYEQEQSLLGAARTSVSDGKGEQLELQSMKQYRSLMKHFNVDQLIARAIDECPPNPGPHNPQMLAVKALVRLRDLSPQYLRRFASYVEAMLWIEKNTNKLTHTKKR